MIWSAADLGSQLPQLTMIDLSWNADLSGPLPPGWGDLANLEDLNVRNSPVGGR